jgi:hypothetical protein
MRKSLRYPSALVLAFTLLAAPALHADEGASLARAEAAYLEVDFESTKRLAHDALHAGGNEPADTLRLYTLLGIASSALGEADAAREAFSRVIALDPQGRLDKTLSPKIRAPYLEIRGQLSARGDVPALEGHLTYDVGTLRLELVDPTAIGHAIEVSYRAEYAESFTSVKLAKAPAKLGPAPAGAQRLEYALVVRDEYGNVIFRRGSEEQPELLALTSPNDRFKVAPSEPAPNAGAYHLAAGLLGGAGLAAVGVGAYFTVQREQAAREWNSSACEQPGSTRGEQCGDVDARRKTSEHVAIGLYAAGGALIVAGVVTLLVTPSARPAKAGRLSLPCVPGVAPLGAACSLSF